jgi:hypothetical protein
MDFSDSIDPMGIRNPDFNEKQQDSMGSDKIPIVFYRILWDSDGIRSDPIRSESGLDVLGLVSFSFVFSCIIQKKDEYIDYFSHN